jgi:hypothetical protein
MEPVSNPSAPAATKAIHKAAPPRLDPGDPEYSALEKQRKSEESAFHWRDKKIGIDTAKFLGYSYFNPVMGI